MFENFSASLHISLYQLPRLFFIICHWYISFQRKIVENTVNHAVQPLHPQHVPLGSRRQHSQCRVLLLELWCKLLLPSSGDFHTCPFLSTHPAQMVPFSIQSTMEHILIQRYISSPQNQNPYCRSKCAGGSAYINCSASYVCSIFLHSFSFSFWLSVSISLLFSFLYIPPQGRPSRWYTYHTDEQESMYREGFCSLFSKRKLLSSSLEINSANYLKRRTDVWGFDFLVRTRQFPVGW